MWLNPETNQTFMTHSQIRSAYPQVSMPATITESVIAELGLQEVPDPVLPPVVPYSVSPRQIRQALTQAGLRSGVEAAVAAGSQDLKDWWEYATAFERQHSMVIAMATGLGVTEQQLDDLFLLAETL